MISKIAENTASAEFVALKALHFLAEDDDRLQTFIALSGLSPEGLRSAAGDLHLLAGVLDHLLQNEPLLMEFAAATAMAPEAIVRARRLLPGASLDS